MNTNNFSALLASPSLVLIYYEFLKANLANFSKILDHAHSVLGLIAGVQMTQGVTWEIAATEAVIYFAIC